MQQYNFQKLLSISLLKNPSYYINLGILKLKHHLKNFPCGSNVFLKIGYIRMFYKSPLFNNQSFFHQTH